jgi:DNA-binding NtrC family response regulator
MSKADCFNDSIKKQAAKVRDQVRNPWAHAVINDWSQTKLNDAFMEMKKLAQMLPNSVRVIQELDEDLTGSKQFEFPMKDFLLNVDKYRTTVKDGQHKKIQDKVRRLENLKKEEIYIKRQFEEELTGQIIPTVEQLVLEEKTTLLKGEAGAGKSSVAVKVMKDWSERSHMKDITCCLFLAAGSDE